MASTNHKAETTTIIKSDRSGRPRYKPAYREEVLDAYEASGMSGPAFARHCGLKYPTFAGWVARRRRGRKAGGPPRARPGGFLLAEFSDGLAEAPLRITLPGGAAAEIGSPSQAALLASLLKALAS
jgi:transposase-like protein